jgi:4-amino-4-deoxy-L-arabinose transferase-like glycosyltransferase
MNKKIINILLIVVLVVNFIGIFGTIFALDSALYAAISKSFTLSNNYLDIFVNGKDWLDKPHFPFWICGLSMEIFGINTFAYKLPSYLFFVLGLFYTFKLAKSLYNEETAYLSVLILGSSLHIVISNNDTRAEAILLGLIMGAVYYMYKLSKEFSIRYLLFSAIFSAAAIMTKGVFVLIIMYSAIFLNLLVNKEHKILFASRWILLLVMTILFCFPELYAVYQQFDLHPEKVVFGNTGVSGVRFFLWDSQFGRFFNNGPIQKSEGDIFFFIHTILWALAPWAIIGFTSLIVTTKKITHNIKNQEYITYFGFSVLFVVFSISKFQLSHYANILFPFITIMIAQIFTTKSENILIQNSIKFSILLYSFLYVSLIGFINIYFQPEKTWIGWFLLIAIIGIVCFILKYSKFNWNYKYLIIGVSTSVLFTFFMNLSFYPSLLKYQSGSEMAFYINKNYSNSPILVSYNDWALEFYSKNNYELIKEANQLKNGNLLITDSLFLDTLKKEKVNFYIIHKTVDFHITQLNLLFLNHLTRKEALTDRFLIKVKQ